MTVNDYHLLKEPITINGKTYRNRMGTSPLGRLILDRSGNVIPFEVANFEERAANGYGVVHVGECFVDDEYSCRENDTPLVFDPDNYDLLEKIRQYSSAIKKHGAIAMVELNHCGQSKVGKACKNKTAIGPCTWEQEDGIHNVAMDEAMMDRVAGNYARCASFMKRAGFDGVNVFCGHGWLLHQFLSPRMNRRTDDYGGSLENRARFPLMVLRRIREAVGRDFLIEIRVSGEESVPGGMEIDEVARFCQMADREGLADIIQVSQGIYREPVLSREFSSMFHEPACNSMNAKYIRDRVSIPVSVVGGINSPEIAEQILEEGRCDIVLLGRQMFADIAFPRKVLEDRADEVNHCVRCARCFSGPHEDAEMPENPDGGPPPLPLIMCTVNPLFCRAMKYPPFEGKAAVSKRVLVIGGGVGGMQAAIGAAERGHRVTLVEKSDRLGGSMNFCDNDIHKGDLRFFKDQLGRKMARRGVEVLLNTEADSALIERIAPEYIICAVGSHPVVPEIPGAERAIHAFDAYAAPEKVGRRVVMIGGGLGGCETALNFADQGREVVVIDRHGELARDGAKLHRDMLLHLLEARAVCLTDSNVTEIREDSVVYLDADGRSHSLPCDTVIYAVGMRKNEAAVEKLRAAAGDIPFVTVGDCREVAQVAQAGFDAFTAAFEI